MESWREAWGEDADAHEGMQHGDDGMLATMRSPRSGGADGADASRLFLECMIAHHEGAVAMAGQHPADGTDPDALARTGITPQPYDTSVDSSRMASASASGTCTKWKGAEPRHSTTSPSIATSMPLPTWSGILARPCDAQSASAASMPASMSSICVSSSCSPSM